ncbi:hypothetical protein V0288_21720 [Pannus brasiliensis CCIBt3594]|uniref:Uncharacterized protein n=1 Tax=Pannus brasiliensis CCIBt3594 TaxID=1427578 RepID=A0AAW9R0P7_9CHRO
MLDLGFALDIERIFSLDPGFARAVQTLKQHLPDLSAGKEN